MGWVCVLGCSGNFITIPFTNFVYGLWRIDIVIPLIPLETMMPVSWECLGWVDLELMRSTKAYTGISDV